MNLWYKKSIVFILAVISYTAGVVFSNPKGSGLCSVSYTHIFCNVYSAINIGWPLITLGSVFAVISLIMLFSNMRSWKIWLRFSYWFVLVSAIIVIFVFPVSMPLGLDLPREGAVQFLGNVYAIISATIVVIFFETTWIIQKIRSIFRPILKNVHQTSHTFMNVNLWYKKISLFVLSGAIYLIGQYFRGVWFLGSNIPNVCEHAQSGGVPFCNSPYLDTFGWPLILFGYVLAFVAFIILFSNKYSWRIWIRFNYWFMPISILIVIFMFPSLLQPGIDSHRAGFITILGGIYFIISTTIVSVLHKTTSTSENDANKYEYVVQEDVA